MAVKEKVLPGTHLKVFYAVTMTSVYRVRIGSDEEEEVPVLIKIANKGGSKVSVGGIISNGTMVAVCKNLQLFVPEGSGVISPMSTFEREVIKVNTHYWGGHTSLIVALFLIEAAALACSRQPDLKPCDPRWKEATIATLKAIGEDHPYCSISCASPRWWLVPPSEWRDTVSAQK